MKRTILIAEDEEKMRRILEVNLQNQYRVLLARDGEEALRLFKENEVNLLLTDMKMPEKDGLSLLHDVKRLRPEIPVILITAYGTIESAVNAMKEGAADYLLKPIKMEEVGLVIDRALLQASLIDENRKLREEIKSLYGIYTIISKHPKMAEIMSMVQQVADSKATVLIEGESGTGKELVARAIHLSSQRTGFPFIVVNATAIPRELLESELFGHEKGAFTGAGKRRIGSFELAHRGTLFLDEIGEMPKELQVKILRAIEGYRFMRVGGTEEIDVDVRLITATHRDLRASVEAGEFREDLFYRLHVVSIKLPPLRERKEEIPIFVEYFLDKFGKKYNKMIKPLPDHMMKAFLQYQWLGNIRELENMIQRFVVLGNEEVVLEELASTAEKDSNKATKETNSDKKAWPSLKEVHREATIKAEAEVIRKTLELTNWNRKKASHLLNISYKALLYKIKEYGIHERADLISPQ